MIVFAKIQATGNDFIVIDACELRGRTMSSEQIRNICDRHYGVGGDGLIIIYPSSQASFLMKYFNRDGSSGNMCGNGLRASCLFAELRNLTRPGTTFLIESDSGLHKATSLDQNKFMVQILPDLSSLKKLDVNQNGACPEFHLHSFIDTGVPHLILLEAGNAGIEYRRKWAEYYRWQKDFDSAGVNVNFVRKMDDNHILVQTYERGVEDFTESCGSGVAAASIALATSGEIDYHQNVIIDTSGGRLEVQFRDEEVYLCGPVEISFTGQLII